MRSWPVSGNVPCVARRNSAAGSFVSIGSARVASTACWPCGTGARLGGSSSARLLWASGCTASSAACQAAASSSAGGGRKRGGRSGSSSPSTAALRGRGSGGGRSFCTSARPLSFSALTSRTLAWNSARSAGSAGSAGDGGALSCTGGFPRAAAARMRSALRDCGAATGRCACARSAWRRPSSEVREPRAMSCRLLTWRGCRDSARHRARPCSRWRRR